MNPVDRANKLISELIEAGWIENDMKALALISVIAPVVRDAEIDMAERAANLLIGDIYETLMGMVSGWRDIAHDHYCQTYNKGMGEGFEGCAKQLEAYLKGMYQRDRVAIARRAVEGDGS